MNRILYLGQKPIGEKCYNLLLEAQSDKLCIAAAVSNTSRCNVWWDSNGIYEVCITRGFPFLDNTKRINQEIGECIQKYKVNTIISVQHPWIIPVDILEMVNFRAFNLHNAKLPVYKGYNSCNHAILNGELRYTSTIHWMEPEVDSGHIAFEETFEIDATDTALSLYQKACQAGEKAFLRLINSFNLDIPIPKYPIKENGNFYSRDSLNAFREIKDPNSFLEIDRKARAFFFPPFEPCYFVLGGHKYYVLPESYNRHK